MGHNYDLEKYRLSWERNSQIGSLWKVMLKWNLTRKSKLFKLKDFLSKIRYRKQMWVHFRNRFECKDHNIAITDRKVHLPFWLWLKFSTNQRRKFNRIKYFSSTSKLGTIVHVKASSWILSSNSGCYRPRTVNCLINIDRFHLTLVVYRFIKHFTKRLTS